MSIYPSINQPDVHFNIIFDRDAAVAEFRRRQAGVEIVAESVWLFRDAEKPGVELAVVVDVLKNSDGIVARLDGKADLLRFVLDQNPTQFLGLAARKSLARRIQRHVDPAHLRTHILDINRQRGPGRARSEGDGEQNQ
jgi:hypothetical protein